MKYTEITEYMENCADISYQVYEKTIRLDTMTPTFAFGQYDQTVKEEMAGGSDGMELGFFTIKNARLTGDGIVFHGDTILTNSQISLGESHIASILNRIGRSDWGSCTSHLGGPHVLMCGPGYPIYGHWIVDFMPRLYILEQLGYDLTALRYVLSSHTPDFAVSMMNSIGIARNQITFVDEYQELVGFDQLIVVSNMRQGSQIHPKFDRAIKDLFHTQIIREHRFHSESYRKIYIKRPVASSQRILVNQAAVEEILREHSYKFISPEEFSFEEQASLFSHCTHLIGEYGSGLHNSAFMASNSILLGLRSSAFHPGFIQSGICQAVGQRYGYIFGNNTGDEIDQKFDIDTRMLERVLYILRVIKL